MAYFLYAGKEKPIPLYLSTSTTKKITFQMKQQTDLAHI